MKENLIWLQQWSFSLRNNGKEKKKKQEKNCSIWEMGDWNKKRMKEGRLFLIKSVSVHEAFLHFLIPFIPLTPTMTNWPLPFSPPHHPGWYFLCFLFFLLRAFIFFFFFLAYKLQPKRCTHPQCRALSVLYMMVAFVNTSRWECRTFPLGPFLPLLSQHLPEVTTLPTFIIRDECCLFIFYIYISHIYNI